MKNFCSADQFFMRRPLIYGAPDAPALEPVRMCCRGGNARLFRTDDDGPKILYRPAVRNDTEEPTPRVILNEVKNLPRIEQPLGRRFFGCASE